MPEVVTVKPPGYSSYSYWLFLFLSPSNLKAVTVTKKRYKNARCERHLHFASEEITQLVATLVDADTQRKSIGHAKLGTATDTLNASKPNISVRR